MGAGRRPAAVHPLGSRQRSRRCGRGAGELRRHLLRQGLHHPQTAQHHDGRRCLLLRRHRSHDGAPLRQRDHARPVRQLGRRRWRRSVQLHRHLAAHRRPRHHHPRPGSGGGPAHSPAPAPGRSIPHAPSGHRWRRRLAVPPADHHRPRDGPGGARPTVDLRPAPRDLGGVHAGFLHDVGPQGHACPGVRCGPAGRRLEQHPQRPSQRSARSIRRARCRGRQPTSGGHRRLPATHDALVAVASAAPGADGVPGAAARGVRQPPPRCRAELRAAAVDVPGRHLHRHHTLPAEDVARRPEPTRGARSRPRPAVAAPGAAGSPGRGRTQRARCGTGSGTDNGGWRRTHPRSCLDADPPGEGVRLATLYRRRRRTELRAGGGGSRHVAGRAGGAHPAVRRALLPRAAGDGRPAQRLGAGVGLGSVLPAVPCRSKHPDARPSSPRRPRRVASLGPQARGGHGGRDGAPDRYQREVRPMSELARRPGPTVRTRVTEFRASTRAPARIGW